MCSSENLWLAYSSLIGRFMYFTLKEDNLLLSNYKVSSKLYDFKLTKTILMFWSL